ncbi:GMC family oxidoreductase N-terminal domain-containing protein [Streptomyces sp. NPDC006923]|uniref:GMC family oxidoreductase n=1 Tax=Streptomyces sp. NPDC006923 TaxID=3155355 RepID=UPI0033E43962
MSERKRVEHEYVVVGAGSSGSVIARRLLDRGHSVHILEAGPEDTSESVHRPSSWPRLFDSELDWAVRTVPQEYAKGRSLRMPRGKVLGGCGSLNGMIYMRGVPSDYDDWSYGGATGWDGESVFPYFLKSEDHEDGASQWHGAGGLQPVCRIRDPHPTSAAFVDAAVSSGFPKTDDFNGEHPLGAGFNHLTMKDGRRMSTWRSFMTPVLGRPEVTVTTLAQAHRVLFDGDRAVGVEYSVRGELRRAYASAEVVLSAGVIGSPKLLLLSGIGPAGHLGEVGVDVRHDMPGVGENLHDHLLVPNIYESAQPMPPGRYNSLESQLYWKSDPRLLGPDLQPIFLHLVYPADGYPVPEHGYTIAPGLVRPLSRGNLRLAAADPARAPLVDPHVLEAAHDLETLVDAVEICREIGQSSAFREWRGAEVAPGPAARTRDDLREYVRSTATTYHHQVGTCRMGQDAMSVVDPELRVHGVRSLRVADASVMPAIPSGNTHAPSMMIGEKAADLVLSEA